MVDPNRVITLTIPPSFAKLYEAIRRQHNIDIDTINSTAIALDPGETTGVAEFDGFHTIRVYQRETKNFGQTYDWLRDLLEAGIENDEGGSLWVSHLRCEDYRVYQWKAQDHAWSPVHTIQLIGAIRVAAHVTGVPLTFCMAQHAKQWWTDSKLNQLGLNPKGLRHGRDALRHLLYYILFPTKDKTFQDAQQNPS